jgi:hypothetical protein
VIGSLDQWVYLVLLRFDWLPHWVAHYLGVLGNQLIHLLILVPIKLLELPMTVGSVLLYTRMVLLVVGIIYMYAQHHYGVMV